MKQWRQWIGQVLHSCLTAASQAWHLDNERQSK